MSSLVVVSDKTAFNVQEFLDRRSRLGCPLVSSNIVRRADVPDDLPEIKRSPSLLDPDVVRYSQYGTKPKKPRKTVKGTFPLKPDFTDRAAAESFLLKTFGNVRLVNNRKFREILLKAVADRHGVPVCVLKEKRYPAYLGPIRREFYYLAYVYLRASSRDIAPIIQRDSSSVRSGISLYLNKTGLPQDVVSELGLAFSTTQEAG